MSKSREAEKREKKFNEQVIQFGFDADGKQYGEKDFIGFSRHARKVLRQRKILDAE